MEVSLTHLDPRHSKLSRRHFIKWSGIGALASATALSACQSPQTNPIKALDTRAAATTPAADHSPTTVPVSPTRSAAATSPTADALSGLNYLHTDGARILDSSGNEVLLSGVNWFGMETETLAPHGIWVRKYTDMLDQIVQLGYNCLRLPFSNELFDPALQPNGIDTDQNQDLKSLNGLQILDKIVVGAGTRGLKVILDQHRPTTDSQSELWYTVELSQDDWIANWRTIALRYRGNDAVIGADLHNEPSGDATWGSGDPQTDWAIAAETCANAIHEINPHWLIFVEGIEKSVDRYGNVFDWTWQGGELIDARARPIKLKVPNQLVYSSHDYGPSLYQQGWFGDPTFPENLPSFWDFHWGYLRRQGVAPVLVGEFGGTSVGTDAEGKWQRKLVEYLKANRIHYTYWALNANSADTGGLLGDDWVTVNQDKQALLKTHQGALIANRAPNVVDTSAVPKASATRLPLKALHYDATMKQWSNVLRPELYVGNKTLDPLDLSKLELRYWFAPNGNPDPKAYDVKLRGTSTKDFGKVLTGGTVRAELVADSGQAYGGNPLWYIRVTFAPGAIAAKRDAAGFGLEIQRKDGGQFFQPSHYSYRDYHWPSEWKRVGLYRDGKLVWGEDPQVYESTQAAKDRAILAQRATILGR
jgi:endoglucanase